MRRVISVTADPVYTAVLTPLGSRNDNEWQKCWIPSQAIWFLFQIMQLRTLRLALEPQQFT